jgi:hypothetical protein
MPDFKNLVYVNGIWVPAGYPGLSGLTTGHVLRATSATAAAFGAVDLTNANAVSGALPDNRGGTGVTAIPKFRVHKNGTNQTGIVSSVSTLLTWSTEVWDTNSNFASNRFTPTVAGKYLFFAELRFESVSAAGLNVCQLAKNGTEVSRGGMPSSSGEVTQITLCSIEDANGSTDYFELYAFQSSGVNKDVNGGSNLTYFGGSLLP